MSKKSIIWSRDICVYCDQAKTLLNTMKIPYEERNLSGNEWSREQLIEMVPNAKTVPQIFIDDEYIGGYTDLCDYYERAKNV